MKKESATVVGCVFRGYNRQAASTTEAGAGAGTLWVGKPGKIRKAQQHNTRTGSAIYAWKELSGSLTCESKAERSLRMEGACVASRRIGGKLGWKRKVKRNILGGQGCKVGRVGSLQDGNGKYYCSSSTEGAGDG